MDYFLLLPEEASELIDLPAAEVLELIESRRLGAFRSNGKWWIPLQCLVEMGGDLSLDAVRSVDALVRRHGEELRSFNEHPEAARVIEDAEYPPGSVGRCLKQALVMSRRFQAMRTSKA